MNTANKYGLGRGLESLLGDEENNLNLADYAIGGTQKNSVFKAESKNELPLDKIVRCPFQPREEFNEEALQALSNSIKVNGVLQPILVRPKGDIFEIIAGERRFQAAKRAGLATIPVIIRNLSDKETLEVALIENIQRENLNAIEEANGLNRLLTEYGHTQDNLSKIIGKSRAYITNTLRLLSLPSDVKKMISDGNLSAGHARALVGFEKASEFAKEIAEKGLSVREAEKMVAESKFPTIKIRYIQPTDYQLQNMMIELEKKLGLKVKINSCKKGNGTVVLQYENPAQLSKIVDILEHR